METEINGVRVVFRDKFPARFGWELMPVIRRLNAERRKYLMLDEKGDPVLDERELPMMVDDYPGYMEIVTSMLTYDEITRFVRGAVLEWDFDGDLDTDKACDELSTVMELLPLAKTAIDLFYTADTSGEEASPSIPASED